MTSAIDHACALLDELLPPPTKADLASEQARQMQRRLTGMGVFMPATSGIGTETTGCSNCGGTMIRNYETDENGNVINVGPYICTQCGAQG